VKEAREEGRERPGLCPDGGYPNGWGGWECFRDAPVFSAGTAAIFSGGRWQLQGIGLLVRRYQRRRLWIVDCGCSEL